MRAKARRTLMCVVGVTALLAVSVMLLAQAGDIRNLDNHSGPGLILSRRLNKKSASRPTSEESQILATTTAVAAGATIHRDSALITNLRRHLDQYRRHPSPIPECNTTDITLGVFLTQKNGKRPWSGRDPWEKFYAQIGKCDLYRPNSRVVEKLLTTMATMPIRAVETMPGGTQVKLIITYENGQKAVFKPMRFGRDYETNPNHFYFSDYERHTAEIAAFHLDKILGFRRVPPVVGRVMKIEEDLWRHADKPLAKTFFYSPAKNLCFVSKCDYYCDTSNAICGNPDKVEGSLQVFLPDDEIVTRDHLKSPYKRTYSKKEQMAKWQTDDTYCTTDVKNRIAFGGRRLLDLIDLAVFDFLMGNLDRHHFETFTVFNEAVYALHLDNGRGFGKTTQDYVDCLAAMYQCCMIRPSTLETLVNFYVGPVSLSEALRNSTASDPVAPVLAEKFYPALERRLETILRRISACIDARGVGNVVRTFYFNPKATVEEEDDEDES